MNKLSLDEAKRLVHESLGISYKEEKFRQFAANILQHASWDINDEINSEYLPNSFQQQFYSYKNLAKMRGKENIDILAVKMKSPGSMLNARATQRRFIGHYLNGIFDGTVKDAALVAFYCDHAPDWRLSLVYKDYSFEDDNIKITLTEPRRSSFLVGPNELTHTAERQFVDLLQDEDRDNIKRLKEAFSVERVTSEFFAEYKKLFQLLTEKVEICLKESTNAREEFGRCGINPTVYAKRLLGQIIFLYFLQKKGWLGVSETERWGDGSPSFLRDLFNNFQYKNFFSDLLNPLFYEAIATDRRKQNHRFDLLHCRIPFLNGGLFEPIGGHDWRKADIFIDNEFFKELFQTFDRYNFTVREDEPLESEVAVDPEMLGKVFESLLGVEERREQGTFYTPRRIVHYMCRESLIRYLDHSINYTLEYSSPKQLLPGVQPRIKQRTLPNVPIPGQIPHFVRREIIPVNDIIQFIRQDEIQHNTEEDTSQTYSKEQSLDQNKKLPQSVLIHAKIIDNALANVKICDPAIGSGAFAVGMMLEIVHARQSLHQIRPEFFGGESDGSGLPSSYELKRNTIGKSLYGVDKDESAVDIAKLRLWLSLVVDEENFEHIKPLPNLDYKIMVGDSLAAWKDCSTLADVVYIEKLKKLHMLYYSTADHNEKIKLKHEIAKARLHCETLGNFDWRVDFSDVMSNKNGEKGFDIVIGNPPYIQLQKMNRDIQKLKDKYKTFASTGDIYCLFYELGYKLIKQHGIIAFITSNKWMRAAYGEKLRDFFLKNCNIRQLIDFAGNKVFDSATVDVNIIILEKSRNNASAATKACIIRDDCTNNLSKYIEQYSVNTQFEIGESWAVLSPIEQNIQRKIEAAGKPLKDWGVQIYRGVLTGYNNAFIIDGIQKDKLIAADPKSAEIIRPILRGRDIKRYTYNFADQWLIATFPSRHYNIDNYPAVKKYLLSFGKERLEQSGKTYIIDGKEVKSRKKTNNKWFETQDNIRYWNDFFKHKIIWAELARTGNAFTYDESQKLILNTSYILVTDDENISLKHLLGLLNSKLILFYTNIISSKFDENGWRWLKQFVEKLPILHTRNLNIEKYVDKIIKLKKEKKDSSIFEKKLNYYIYDLYDLDDSEKLFIENNVH